METSDSVVNTNHVQISGTAEANSTITVYDGTTAVGTGSTNSSGSWSVTTSALSTGSHNLTATATDVAGNVSALSGPLDPVIGSTSTTTTVSTGTPQAPHLLDSYGADRPSWQVAGVDYYVGCPQGLALKDPSTISMAGVTVNASTHMITVTGNNVTLDGYDFSLNGGWGVSIQSTNVTISDSNFKIGSNSNTPIYGTLSSGNVTVTNCTIDGAMAPNVGLGGLILMSGAGTLTVDHTWLKNAGCDMIDMNNNGASALIAENNFFQNGGVPGAHGDFVQFLGHGPYTATILHNTTTEASGLSSQGFMVEPDLGSTLGVISGGEIGYNTMVGYNNAFTAVTEADLTGKFTVDNNYFDPTGTSGGLAFGGGRGGPNDSTPYSQYINNVNMVNGSIVQDSNAAAEAAASTTTTTSSTPPAAPVISSWSPDTGVVGDSITNANHLTIKGTAVAGSTVKVYDGSTLIGTVTADSTGAW
ncbi:MAG: Ig-like domain-containing protein, partial [Mycobacterium sp.]|nr:Ig-like domain-containing protein [Mycobacterium sp.]